MAVAPMVWGIDVGRCALKALKLRAVSDDEVAIVGFDYIEHSKILSQPGVNRAESIAAALEKFLSRNDLSKDLVVVGVPGQHTLARFTKLPPVSAKRIPDIIRYEADQQIPFDIDEVIWDYQTFEQEGVPDIEAGIFAMKRDLLHEHLLHFEQAAIGPIAVQSGPLAVYNAAYFEGMLGEKTTILVDLGTENADLVIATSNGLWTRTIPIGGNHCTEALAKAFKLSFSKSENLKRTVETSKYRRQILQAMRPVFADIVQELQRSIGFYSSTHQNAEFEKVVGVGNGFRLSGLSKYLKQNLGMPVETPSSFEKLASPAGGGTSALDDNRLSFFQAYGLAIQGLDRSKVSSNLLPREIAKQIVWKKKRPAFAAAAAALVLAGGLVWFRQTADRSALAAASTGTEDVNISLEQADDVLNGGSRSFPSPRATAAGILGAGQALKRAMSNLSSQGSKERDQCETLVALQHNKTVIPSILQAIHDSVPTPEGALGPAQTPEEIKEALAGGRVPRGQRKSVFTEKINMQYEPNLNDFVWQSMVEVEVPINDPESELAGIKVEIICTTPNDGGASFIDDTFMAALRENGRRPGTGFYFDRVFLIDGGKVPETADMLGVAGRRASATGRSSGKTTRLVDVITNEVADDDWRFEIWIDVILQDYVEPEAEETPEAPEDD